jgi:FAD dependent oxidoreductase TIGR03364
MGAGPPEAGADFDLAVVGSGIVGLAHALAAARLGKRVVVIDREARAVGASVRNFGFVTVTGQERGASWDRARRSRDVWAAVAPQAGIEIEQRGLWVSLRREASLDVARAFLETEMGQGCRLLTGAALADLPFCGAAMRGVLHSPHDLRVESRLAIPRLAAWLEARWGVTFIRGAAVLSVAPPVIETSRGSLRAQAAVVCPGDDIFSLFPERIAGYGVSRCTLSMLRLADPGLRLASAVMSDLGLVRYAGYAALPAAAALRAELDVSQAAALAHGIHLIVTQSADGTLVVGDSHHYGDTADPFMDGEVEALMLEEFTAALGFPAPPVVERWMGSYASAPDRTLFVDTPASDVRLVMVTSGTGASTAFAIGEAVIGELYGRDLTTVPLTPAGEA